MSHPISSTKLARDATATGLSIPPLLLAMPTGYSHAEFLHTSETIEFILDFSTGVIVGKTLRIAISPIGGSLVFSAKKGSYLGKQRPPNGHLLAEDDASGDY